MTRHLGLAALLAFGLSLATSLDARELGPTDQVHFEARWRELSIGLENWDGNGLRAQQLWEAIFAERDAIAGATRLAKWRGTLQTLRLETVRDSGLCILGEIALSDSDPSALGAEVTPHIVRFVLRRGASRRLEPALGALSIGQPLEFSGRMRGEWNAVRAASPKTVAEPPRAQKPGYLEVLRKTVEVHFGDSRPAAGHRKPQASGATRSLNEFFQTPSEPDAMVFDVELTAIAPLRARESLFGPCAELSARYATLDSLAKVLAQHCEQAASFLNYWVQRMDEPKRAVAIPKIAGWLAEPISAWPRESILRGLQELNASVSAEGTGRRLLGESVTIAALAAEIRSAESALRLEQERRDKLLAFAREIEAMTPMDRLALIYRDMDEIRRMHLQLEAAVRRHAEVAARRSAYR